ncbi:MAG: ABC transporter ATP-binding protein/permease [Spirochaetaceae bacterium]|jgi:ATP-binding cassette subfamily B protein|nr:ABC transporter ATP-binding protein/permease [Spirochaetaceae bacterium]
MRHLLWAWNHIGPKRPLFVLGLCIAAISSAMLVVNPMLAVRLIDEVIVPQNTALLLPLLGTMFAVQVGRLLLRYGMVVLMEISSTSMLTAVRRRLYDGLQNADMAFLRRFPTGNLMTRMTSDLERTRHTMAWVSYQIVDAVTIFVSALVFLLFVHVPLALCLAAVTPFILIVSRLFVGRIRARFVLLRQKLTSLSTTVSENIDGNRVVKAFAREPHEIDKFEAHNAAFRDTSVENALIAAKYQPALEGFSQALAVITLAVGGIFLMRGEMTAGQYLAFSSFTWALANPLRMLGLLLADIQAFNAASAMIEEIYDPERGIKDKPDAIPAPETLRGEVEFRDVSYRVDGTGEKADENDARDTDITASAGSRDILSGVSFKVKAGETLGILGATGAGKTTVVNMLLRFIEPSSGKVLIDGRNIADYTLSSLRSHIGLASQDVFLFSDTVSANIAYGAERLSGEEIVKRAVDADAAGFVEAMGDGYDTLIGERGVGLSGGQKQRLSLARALAIRPALLILDDTTSAVDSETERYIQERLRDLDFPCTKIIIAQRLSSFRGASQILVMDRGRIVEYGTHEELLGNNGFYRKIWDLQNGMGGGASLTPTGELPR